MRSSSMGASLCIISFAVRLRCFLSRSSFIYSPSLWPIVAPEVCVRFSFSIRSRASCSSISRALVIFLGGVFFFSASFHTLPLYVKPFISRIARCDWRTCGGGGGVHKTSSSVVRLVVTTPPTPMLPLNRLSAFKVRGPSSRCIACCISCVGVRLLAIRCSSSTCLSNTSNSAFSSSGMGISLNASSVISSSSAFNRTSAGVSAYLPGLGRAVSAIARSIASWALSRLRSRGISSGVKGGIY